MPGRSSAPRRSTRSATRSASTSRSTASSRFRHWLRSSCAIARSTGPARAITRRFCAGVSAEEALDVEAPPRRASPIFCACWPPGPLEREKRSSISSSGRVTERVTRIDSPAMAAILLDVDGVLHVSGEPIPGAAEAVARAARRQGHSAPVRDEQHDPAAGDARGGAADAAGSSSTTTSCRRRPPPRRGRSPGRRVFALVMAALVADLEGIELVGDGAEAVLLGGCDETEEPGRVFSYMNLGARLRRARSSAPSSTACTRTSGGRPPAARCSTRARSSPGSSTRPGSRRPCSGSRARPTSRLRSRRSAPSRG